MSKAFEHSIRTSYSIYNNGSITKVAINCFICYPGTQTCAAILLEAKLKMTELEEVSVDVDGLMFKV